MEEVSIHMGSPSHLVFVSLLLLGCGETQNTPPGAIRTFLVSRLEVSVPDPEGRVRGIDLDGMDSDGSEEEMCVNRHEDFVSIDDPTEHGVDNVVGGVLSLPPSPGCQGMCPSTSDLIAMGALAIAVQITRLDSAEGDMVDVRVGTAHVAGCDPLDRESCRPVLDGTQLLPDQPMVFRPVGPVVSMAVTDGRLRGQLGPLRVPAALLGEWGASAPAEWVTLHNTQIDVHVSTDGLDGVLGGGLAVDELVDLSVAIDPSLESERDEVRWGFELVSDLDPGAAEPAVCGALSLGAQMTAVPITVTN